MTFESRQDHEWLLAYFEHRLDLASGHDCWARISRLMVELQALGLRGADMYVDYLRARLAADD